MITKIYIDKAFGFDGHSVNIVQYDLIKKKTYIAQPLVFKEIKEGACFPNPPTLFVGHQQTPDFLKELLQMIKENGLELNLEAEGELKATKIHLEDMRLLAKVKGRGVS